MRNLTSSTPCSVYSEDDPFTSYVQAFLAAAALGSLFYKRSLESPRRPLRTWSLDVSKLGLGAVYAHLCNMAVAKGLGTFAGTGLQDEVRGEQHTHTHTTHTHTHTHTTHTHTTPQGGGGQRTGG
mmetsp:Transcript_16732/g.33374  ORF Transcript_16732/g.33374 Transcript_16732/m.33374 type:complete len:125 (-) Transcript_16732:72-446(-)